MMHTASEVLATLNWDFGKGIPIGGYTLRFYQIFFALGFVTGYRLMLGFFKKEGIPQDWLDRLLTYMVIATIIGARLGHVFFYQWDYYKLHPDEILKVWEGGLASHGAAIAIVIALIWFSRKVSKRSPLWILDRVVITVALAGCFIRLGNWFNSEIYGKPGNSAIETVYLDLPRQDLLRYWDKSIESVAFVPLEGKAERNGLNHPRYTLEFTYTAETSQEAAALEFADQVRFLSNRAEEDRQLVFPDQAELVFAEGTPLKASIEVWGIPRHPTQLIEAFGYLMIFFLLWYLYERTSAPTRQGLLFGLFLVTVFGYRYAVEFFKVVQVEAEKDMALNLGQSLSIPLVAVGLIFVIRALRSPAMVYPPIQNPTE
ncbi:prolipoprotein diacylglyceryl transferase [bacterium]|nr:prolipoprotein diacylglyceryl transferase [bacterium]